VSATQHLNAMNKVGPHPWQVSFSYARALQDPALKAWKGEAGNVATAQRIFYHRAKMNSAARSGSYTAQMESAA
jgi:fructose-bisphosphate aldolase, class I